MLSTYGAHQELAARALNELVGRHVSRRRAWRGRGELVRPEVADLLLSRRQALVDALRERIPVLGGQQRAAAMLATSRHRVTLHDATNHTLPLLHDVLLRHDDAGSRRRPTDVLTPGSPTAAETLGTVGRETNTTLELWRTAAVETMAATHAIQQSTEKPWARDPAARWPLITDLAVTTEALVVLDRELEERGLLRSQTSASAQAGRGDLNYVEQRMITAHAARLGRWYGTSDAADLAIAPQMRPVARIAERCRMVDSVEDLAPALRQLSRFIAPIKGVTEAERLGVRGFRAAAITQSRTLEFAKEVAGSAGVDYDWDTHRRLLVELFDGARRLTDADEAPIPRAALAQVSELSRGVQRLQARRAGGDSMDMTPAQRADLVTATNEAGRALGRRLRHELLRDDSTIRQRGLDGGPGARVLEGHPVERRARKLGSLRGPAREDELPPTRRPSRANREALRETLDTTPGVNLRAPRLLNTETPLDDLANRLATARPRTALTQLRQEMSAPPARGVDGPARGRDDVSDQAAAGRRETEQRAEQERDQARRELDQDRDVSEDREL